MCNHYNGCSLGSVLSGKQVESKDSLQSMSDENRENDNCCMLASHCQGCGLQTASSASALWPVRNRVVLCLIAHSPMQVQDAG